MEDLGIIRREIISRRSKQTDNWSRGVCQRIGLEGKMVPSISESFRGDKVELNGMPKVCVRKRFRTMLAALVSHPRKEIDFGVSKTMKTFRVKNVPSPHIRYTTTGHISVNNLLAVCMFYPIA